MAVETAPMLLPQPRTVTEDTQPQASAGLEEDARVNPSITPNKGPHIKDPHIEARQARLQPLLRAHGLQLTVFVQDVRNIPQLEEDETYRLTLQSAQCHIEAASTWGALHGLTTLYQLLQQPALPQHLLVDDAPRFAWRGVLIDVARHFLSISLLQRVVDGMAALKLNVLHLHLTDDQAFRWRSRCFPELADTAAYNSDELRALVTYAAERGVRVVPELDVPGHVHSWLVAHPELGFAQVSPTRRFGVHKACLDPTSEPVYEFLQQLFTELGEVFPDQYVHIGGDEVHPAWWQEDAQVQQFMQQHGFARVADLQNYFNQRICAQLTTLGKRAVGWDEVLHKHTPHMVVQNWRGATTRDRALQQGLPCLVSAGYYLDLHYPNEYHYQYDPAAPQSELLALEDSWQADPRLEHVAAGIEWTKQWRAEQITKPVEHDGVLGGEACLWSELVDEQTLEVRLFSRLPAVAERLWSPAHVTDLADFYQRLEATLDLAELNIADLQRARLAGLGLDAAACAVAVLLEPVRWYARLLGEEALQARLQGQEMPQARPYQTDTSLNRVVDFISPESLAARALAAQSDVELSRQALVWSQLEPALWPEDVQPAIRALITTGQVLQQWLDDSMPPSACRQLLQDLDKPYGEYMLAVLPVLRQRIDHVSKR
ncbi:MAG: family 20 glycosylhydrolase [Pseudomonadota bacterium]